MQIDAPVWIGRMCGQENSTVLCTLDVDVGGAAASR